MASGVVVVEVPSGTADVQAVTGGGNLCGWSFREAAGTAAVATVIIRDGTSASGKIVAVIELAGDQSVGENYLPQGLRISDGIYVDRVDGTTEGAIYWS